MILKSLEIQGFKSFPDKTVLSFGSGITAVVGPNGSGKSNISDAVRWVLGEQSSKTLRGSKMEDVIFNGTAQRKAVGFAEVSLTIDNRSRTLDFDADDVKVTRRYYRSGESEYLLNNATVRLKDVQLLFMDTGLGRDGYSIIGQGRIDDLVSSRSDERREIFEEAAGIAKYRYRKNEAERRLKATEENLLRLRDILQELEERVGPLKTQSEKAKKYLEYAQEKKGLEIGVWLNTLDRSRDTLRELDSRLELARTQYDAAGEAMDDTERELEALVESARALEVELESLRGEISQREEEAVRCDGNADLVRNNREHNEENIARIQSESEQMAQGNLQLDALVAEREAEIVAKQEQIAEAERCQVALAEEWEALLHSNEEVSGRIEELNRRAAELAAQLSDIRVRSVTGESSLAEITLRVSQLTAALASQTEQRETLRKEREAVEDDYTHQKETVAQLQNAARGYEMRLSSRTSRLETARQEADRLLLNVEEKAQRIHLLEEMERNLEGFSHSVRIVAKQAQRGELRGIRGPVSRLIQTDGEYALAIETALGGAAQHVIVEREEDAKRSIAYLRDTKNGRATFLPMASMKGSRLQEKGLESENGFVGIASDLVRTDKEYEEIAQYLLGRVAVAEDMDYAVVIARKYGYKFRIVTLDGQVVNAGGSLSGGSHVKEAGLLSRRSMTEAEQQTAAISEQVGTVEAELNELSGGRQQLSEQREKLAERMSEQKLAVVGYRTEIDGIRAAIEELRSRQADQEGAREQMRLQIEQLQAHSEELTAQELLLREQAEHLRSLAKQSEEAIKALQERRMADEARQTTLRQQSRGKAEERELLGREVVRLEEKYAAAQKETEDVLRRLYEEYELTRAGAEEQAAVIEDMAAATRRLTELKNKIRALGSVNVEAIEEYREVSERYEFLSTQVQDVEVSREELLKLIGELTVQMREMFLDRFRQINVQFGEVFRELFGGGKAELVLTNPDDILGSGIEMHAQPPGKVILNMDALSGGEKALVATALLFAILKVTPSPFCMLDEVEAALDDVNVDRYAQYLRRMCDKTQFIVITHRRGTMEEADVLYGVTMQEQGISKLLELRASEVEAKLGITGNAPV